MLTRMLTEIDIEIVHAQQTALLLAPPSSLAFCPAEEQAVDQKDATMTHRRSGHGGSDRATEEGEGTPVSWRALAWRARVDAARHSTVTTPCCRVTGKRRGTRTFLGLWHVLGAEALARRLDLQVDIGMSHKPHPQHTVAAEVPAAA